MRMLDVALTQLSCNRFLILKVTKKEKGKNKKIGEITSSGIIYRTV